MFTKRKLKVGDKIIFKRYKDCVNENPNILLSMREYLDGETVYTVSNSSHYNFRIKEIGYWWSRQWIQEILDPSILTINAGDKFIFKELKDCKEGLRFNPGMTKEMEKYLDGHTIRIVKKIIKTENNNIFFSVKDIGHWSWITEWIKEIIGKDMMDFSELDKVIGIMEGNIGKNKVIR